MYVESGYNVVRVSMRIVLRIGPPSYTILVRSCVSLYCCCTAELVYCMTVAFTQLLSFNSNFGFGKGQKSQGAEYGL